MESDASVDMTVLMHNWYYEKKDLKRTPSILGGLDIERENRYRREGARFIINVGTKMGLRYDTMATGVIYFHRFYMFHSFKTFPRYVTACCCLFLAGKVEETPKKCKDIIRIAKTFLAESQFAQFGDDPKEEVMTLERILLQTIKFDLQVDHPYGHLLKYAKSLKGDKSKLQSMVQMAWTFINDSLCTTLCLQWEPEVIAIALMYLAGKLSKFEVVDWNGRLSKHNHWWDMFVEGMSIELLEDICHQVLDLYSMPAPKSPQASPPATPPTKSTRKTSQPPSPVETTTSPAQIKPKDPPVGQPIPRLEPGELKRKTLQTDNKDTVPDAVKIPRIAEGKAIPTISSHSPKKAPSSLGSDTQPSSPSTPAQDAVKVLKDVSRVTSDPAFKSGLASSNPPNYAQSSSFSHTDNTPSKLPQHASQVPVTSFSVTVPPPGATYTQTAPPFFHDNQPFPNIQQPPPQIFSQRPPVPFQHPPPAPPSGPHPPPPPGLHPPPLPHQYPPGLPPAGVPPFNSQFPPPRHQPPPPPPSLLGNPPPAPVPGMTQHPPPTSHQGVQPVPGMMRNIPPPPPPGVHRHMTPDNIYRPGSDMYSNDQRNRPPKDRMPHNQDFVPRPRFEGNFHGRRDPEYDAPFPRDGSYRRLPPPHKFNPEFERPPHPNRRFSLDHRKHERGPLLSASNNNQQHGGAPTGIPPVRITGRY